MSHEFEFGQPPPKADASSLRAALLCGLLYADTTVKRYVKSPNSKFGSGTEIRTPNLAVNSRLLYRLSYPGSDLEF